MSKNKSIRTRIESKVFVGPKVSAFCLKTKIHLPRGIDKELLFLLAIPSSEGIYLISVKKGESLDDIGNSIGVYEYIEFTPLKLQNIMLIWFFIVTSIKNQKGAITNLKSKVGII